MLDTLLESRAKIRRPIAGALVSVCAHTALIGAAVYATAHAHAPPASTSDPKHIYFVPRAEQPPTRIARTSPGAIRSREHPILKFFDVPSIDVKVPTLEMMPVTTKPDDFGVSRTGAGESVGLPGASSDDPGSTFRADQVEKQVALKGGSAPPVYPTALQNAGIEGKVIAMFVVDEQGRVDEVTLRFISSDHRQFEDAVRVALKRMRFIPAEVGGKKVRQLVEMPFVFTMRK